MSWWGIEEQISYWNQKTTSLLFSYLHMCRISFFCSYSTCFSIGVIINNNKKKIVYVFVCKYVSERFTWTPLVFACFSAFFFKLQFLHLTWVAFLWEIIMSIAEGSPGDCRASLYRPLVSSRLVSITADSRQTDLTVWCADTQPARPALPTARILSCTVRSASFILQSHSQAFRMAEFHSKINQLQWNRLNQWIRL